MLQSLFCLKKCALIWVMHLHFSWLSKGFFSLPHTLDSWELNYIDSNGSALIQSSECFLRVQLAWKSCFVSMRCCLKMTHCAKDAPCLEGCVVYSCLSRATSRWGSPLQCDSCVFVQYGVKQDIKLVGRREKHAGDLLRWRLIIKSWWQEKVFAVSFLCCFSSVRCDSSYTPVT